MSRTISATIRSEATSSESPMGQRSDLAPKLFLAIVGCTFAGLLWLGLASKQAAIGREIAKLDGERRDLLERRVTALLDHAEATAPERLEARARALGFIPSDAVMYLPVHDPIAMSGGGGVAEPLTISRRLAPEGGIQMEPADVSGVLMTLGAAAPASADELDARTEPSQR